jgi:NADPH-dependent curcumin reductase CurA
VIGSAGGAEKVAFLKEIGVRPRHRLQGRARPERGAGAAAPDGIDVYFDNVGGAHLEAALNSAKMFARFAICGMISIYNATRPEPGPSNLAQLIGKNIRMEGFIVSHHFGMMPQYIADLTKWVRRGQGHLEGDGVRGPRQGARRLHRPLQGREPGQDAGQARLA